MKKKKVLKASEIKKQAQAIKKNLRHKLRPRRNSIARGAAKMSLVNRAR